MSGGESRLECCKHAALARAENAIQVRFGQAPDVAQSTLLLKPAPDLLAPAASSSAGQQQGQSRLAWS